MTLPSVGQISFFDINVELDRSSTAQIGLDEAESGTYATINRCSSPFPNNDRPASITEWYSYNHDAASSLVNAGGFDYSATSCAVACGLAVDCSSTLYYNTAATAVYTDNKCNNFPSVGYYATCDRSNCYNIGSSGIVNSITACATTTTTSTTTAPPCADPGQPCTFDTDCCNYPNAACSFGVCVDI